MFQYNINITEEHKELMFKMAVIQKDNFKKVKVHNGHEIYMMNIKDGVISKAPAIIETAYNTKNNKPFKVIHLLQDLNYLYLPALNLKSAHKKFENIIIYVDASLHRIKELSALHPASASLSLKGDGNIETNEPINNP